MAKAWIETKWLEYEKRVVPPNASIVQRIETKAAFYAGAGALAIAICNSGTSGRGQAAGVVLDVDRFARNRRAN